VAYFILFKFLLEAVILIKYVSIQGKSMRGSVEIRKIKMVERNLKAAHA